MEFVELVNGPDIHRTSDVEFNKSKARAISQFDALNTKLYDAYVAASKDIFGDTKQDDQPSTIMATIDLQNQIIPKIKKINAVIGNTDKVGITFTENNIRNLQSEMQKYIDDNVAAPVNLPRLFIFLTKMVNIKEIMNEIFGVDAFDKIPLNDRVMNYKKFENKVLDSIDIRKQLPKQEDESLFVYLSRVDEKNTELYEANNYACNEIFGGKTPKGDKLPEIQDKIKDKFVLQTDIVNQIKQINVVIGNKTEVGETIIQIYINATLRTRMQMYIGRKIGGLVEDKDGQSDFKASLSLLDEIIGKEKVLNIMKNLFENGFENASLNDKVMKSARFEEQVLDSIDIPKKKNENLYAYLTRVDELNDTNKKEAQQKLEAKANLEAKAKLEAEQKSESEKSANLKKILGDYGWTSYVLNLTNYLRKITSKTGGIGKPHFRPMCVDFLNQNKSIDQVIADNGKLKDCIQKHYFIKIKEDLQLFDSSEEEEIGDDVYASLQTLFEKHQTKIKEYAANVMSKQPVKIDLFANLIDVVKKERDLKLKAFFDQLGIQKDLKDKGIEARNLIRQVRAYILGNETIDAVLETRDLYLVTNTVFNDKIKNATDTVNNVVASLTASYNAYNTEILGITDPKPIKGDLTNIVAGMKSLLPEIRVLDKTATADDLFTTKYIDELKKLKTEKIRIASELEKLFTDTPFAIGILKEIVSDIEDKTAQVQTILTKFYTVINITEKEKEKVDINDETMKTLVKTHITNNWAKYCDDLKEVFGENQYLKKDARPIEQIDGYAGFVSDIKALLTKNLTSFYKAVGVKETEKINIDDVLNIYDVIEHMKTLVATYVIKDKPWTTYCDDFTKILPKTLKKGGDPNAYLKKRRMKKGGDANTYLKTGALLIDQIGKYANFKQEINLHANIRKWEPFDQTRKETLFEYFNRMIEKEKAENIRLEKEKAEKEKTEKAAVNNEYNELLKNVDQNIIRPGSQSLTLNDFFNNNKDTNVQNILAFIRVNGYDGVNQTLEYMEDIKKHVLRGEINDNHAKTNVEKLLKGMAEIMSELIKMNKLYTQLGFTNKTANVEDNFFTLVEELKRKHQEYISQNGVSSFLHRNTTFSTFDIKALQEHVNTRDPGAATKNKETVNAAYTKALTEQFKQNVNLDDFLDKLKFVAANGGEVSINKYQDKDYITEIIELFDTLFEMPFDAQNVVSNSKNIKTYTSKITKYLVRIKKLHIELKLIDKKEDKNDNFFTLCKDLQDSLTKLKSNTSNKLLNEEYLKAKQEEEEEKQIADEKKRLADEEEKRLADEEEKRLAEKQIADEEEKRLEEKRLADEEAEKKAANKIVNAAKSAKAAKSEAEKKRLKKIEDDRIAKIEIAAEKKAEEDRLAKIEVDRIAEKDRLAKIEADRIAAEKKAEAERQAKDAEAERQAKDAKDAEKKHKKQKKQKIND